MKTRLLLALLICSMAVNNTSAQMPNYDGAPLEFDKSFVRKKVGDAKVASLAEISGISCSRELQVTCGHRVMTIIKYVQFHHGDKVYSLLRNTIE